MALCAIALMGLALPAAASAQSEQFPPDAQVHRSDETGKVRFVGTAPGRPDERPRGFSRTSRPSAVARAYLERHAQALGLDGRSSLRGIRSVEGPRGAATVRYQQMLEGIEVLGGQFSVQLDDDGNIRSLMGEAVPGGESFDAKPEIDASAAERAAIAHIAKGHEVPASSLSASSASLKVFDSRILGGPGQDVPTLVYATTVVSSRDAELRRLVFIDADRGFEVATIDQTPEAKNRTVCDAGNTASQYPCTSPVLSEGGTYSGSVPDVRPAYDYSGATYDFFKSRYNRDSLDGKGFPLKSTVRYCDPGATCPFANAFWDGTQMVYGEGYATADDVVGHELTHGFTEFTSGLFYYYQSGAINESLSDVFGEFVDQVTPSPNDTTSDRWRMGESLPIGAIRDMRDPGAFGDPDRMGSPNYTLDPGEEDSGGVHQNSGVNNKATFLITDGGSFNGRAITGLGLEKAARIYYSVQTEFLNSASDYADLGSALGQACDNLVGTAGITTANCTEVRDAVAATEMLTNDGGAPEGPACTTAGQSPAYVSFDDFENATPPWAASIVSGSQNVWSVNSGYATSGQRILYGADIDSTSDSAMARTEGVLIPSNAFLRYRHAYGFEDGVFGTTYDGGVVEWSDNNGASWNSLAAGYNGTIDTDNGNPLAGRPAYVAESNGFVSESVPLTALAGRTVRFRFRIGTDPSVGDLGWVIDDVGVHTCGADSTPPATTITGGPAAGSSGNPSSGSFTFTSSELGSNFRCRLDAGGFVPCRSPRPYTGLSEGSHTFSVVAVDPAGLADPTPATRTFTVGTPGGKASVSGGTLSFNAASGQANTVTVSRSTTHYTVKDTTAPVSPGSGCTRVTANEVRCAVSGINALRLNAGDLNDKVKASTPTRATILGGPGHDSLTGGSGPDTFDGGTGADMILGGGGVDTVTYASRTGAVTVDIDGVADDGSSLDANGSARDNVRGDVENLIGGKSHDRLTGGTNSNTLDGGNGADVMSGGGGVDTVTYATRTGAVTVDIDGAADDGSTLDANGSARDNVRGDVENLIGGKGTDTLTGSASRNRITSRDSARDVVTCRGALDTVVADSRDTVSSDCESVSR